MKRITTFLSISTLLIATGAALAQAPADSTKAASSPTGAAATDVVKRAVFCSAVTDREPVDAITTLAPPADHVCFFTEITGMEGKTVKHRWMHSGAMVAEVPMSIGAARWRCYSTKTLGEGAAGTWSVEVVDDAGTKLAEATFTYGAGQ